MKAMTFDTLLAMIRQDPLTETQWNKLGHRSDEELIDNAEAARLLGVSEQLMRKIPIRRSRANRYLRYFRRDVLDYRDAHTSTD